MKDLQSLERGRASESGIETNRANGSDQNERGEGGILRKGALYSFPQVQGSTQICQSDAGKICI